MSNNVIPFDRRKAQNSDRPQDGQASTACPEDTQGTSEVFLDMATSLLCYLRQEGDDKTADLLVPAIQAAIASKSFIVAIPFRVRAVSDPLLESPLKVMLWKKAHIA